jgi:hypothetical protein
MPLSHNPHKNPRVMGVFKKAEAMSFVAFMMVAS